MGGEEFVAGEEGFALAHSVEVEAGVELVAAGVEQGSDWGDGGPTGELGEDGEAGDGDQWEVEGFREALGGAEAYANSSEGAGAVNDGDGLE